MFLKKCLKFDVFFVCFLLFCSGNPKSAKKTWETDKLQKILSEMKSREPGDMFSSLKHVFRSRIHHFRIISKIQAFDQKLEFSGRLWGTSLRKNLQT